jgi:hypothetical protein
MCFKRRLISFEKGSKIVFLLLTKGLVLKLFLCNFGRILKEPILLYETIILLKKLKSFFFI